MSKTKKTRTNHRQGQIPVTDAVVESALLWEDAAPKLEWRVRLVGGGRQLQETVYVIAPNFEAAEAAASAFATVNDGVCERYRCERVYHCASDGCDNEIVEEDARTVVGDSSASAIESALDPDSVAYCSGSCAAH